MRRHTWSRHRCRQGDGSTASSRRLCRLSALTIRSSATATMPSLTLSTVSSTTAEIPCWVSACKRTVLKTGKAAGHSDVFKADRSVIGNHPANVAFLSATAFSESAAGTNYCIHILSSKPTMDSGLLDQLLNASLSLGLNTQNLPFNLTQQDGCW